MKIFFCLLISISFFIPVLAQGAAESNITRGYYPGDHELLMMPTAYTMDKGSGYFTDYELFFLNATYAPTSTTHVGIFFLFPIVEDFLQTLTVGAKQNYFRSEYFQGALWGSYTIKNNFYTVGNVFSIGRKEMSLHVGFGYAGEKENNIFLILAGGRYDFSEHISGIIEYTNAKELLDTDFGGFLTFGVRFRGSVSSWEIAGTRVLEHTEGLLFLPYLKATFYF